MSLAMNSCFDTSCFNEYARKFGYSAETITEALANTAQNKLYSKIVGSRAEATDIFCSDVDILLIDQCSTVGYNPQEETYSNKVYYLLTSGPSTRAGYTKLQIYHNGKSDYKESSQHYSKNFVSTNEGKTFLTNISVLPTRLPSTEKPLYTKNHGPAETSTFAILTLDIVPAYESEIIPKEMMPWFERNRPYNWPSKETCHLFKSMGCFYVGVGHLKSQEKTLEWRISPTRQELYLMLNLNPTQYRCYIALKLIKKEFVEKVCDDMLSSYHCKTALFYTIETTDPNTWQPHFLIQCVLTCLKLLLKWVTQRNCPNYFIPEENMFETKLIDNNKIEKLQVFLGKLKHISLGSLMGYIFSTQFKSEKESIWGSIISLKLTLKNVYNITWFPISEQMKKTMAIYNQAKCPNEQNNLVEIKKLCPYEPNNGLLIDVLEERLLHLKRFEHLLSVMRREMTVNKYLDIHKDITETLPEDLQYCLKLASLATAQKDNAMCDHLLQKNRHIAYRASVNCCCDTDNIATWIIDKTITACEQKLASAGKCINSMSIVDILQQFTMCLNFIESELTEGMVMAPLHLEAFKTVGKSQSISDLSEKKELVLGLTSIHPVTYMYFIQYTNSDIMKKKSDMFVALEKLENMNLVSLCEGIYSHPDIILNLLGHIYITKEWYRLAIQFFRRSWQLLPDINAAKWHIMFLLFGCTKQVS